MKGRLLASAPTLDGIRECISDFYCGAVVTLIPVDESTWRITRVWDGKALDGLRVVLKRGRYRFEMID